jgi:hypothetical protein
LPSEKVLKIISLLESVATEHMDPALALKAWPEIDSESDRLIASSWHELHHYFTDIDIREKDPGYGVKQREGLRKRATEIRQKYELNTN